MKRRKAPCATATAHVHDSAQELMKINRILSASKETVHWIATDKTDAEHAKKMTI